MSEQIDPHVVDVPKQIESVIPNLGNTRLYADIVTGRVSGRDDKGCDGFIDYRRARGEELRHWRAALGGRENAPANAYMLGDSVMLGAGQTLYVKAWNDIFRDAMQREYRNGGEGFIPMFAPATNTFANRWTNAGTPTLTDFGFGWGRRAIFHDTTDDISTITAYCDRFYIVYFASVTSGSFKITIDGVAATGSPQSAASAIAMSGRIWDSGTITLGTHTIVVTPNASSNSIFVEGAMFFATDNLLGIRFFSGGHGGHRAEHYNGDTTEDGTAVGCRRMWPQIMFQPKTLVLSGAASLSSAGGTTLTWTGTSPVLTNSDIGEVIFAGTDIAAFPRGLRVVSVSSATVCVVNKTVPAGTYTAAMTRSRVTDATTVIGSVAVSSPTMAFNAWDTGKTISPSTQFIAGTVIKRVISATQIEIYPVAIASATATGTIQILNRQSLPMRPDLFIIEFGGNDMFAGIPKAEYKANMQLINDTMQDVGQLDVSSMTGIYNDERPSVATMAMWSTGYRADANMVISSTSGQPTIQKATTGLIRELRFNSADIGKAFSGAPVAALTITAVSADGNSATLSGNATATSTNSAVILLQRQFVDSQWHDYRSAQFELSEENSWSMIDLYNIGGAAGVLDLQQLISSDGLHPNDRGGQWIADEMSTLFGGVKKLASIPQGLFDNPGEMLKAESTDKARKVPGILVKTTANAVSGTTAGVMVSIPELAFTIAPSETLSFEFNLIWTTAAATSGILFDFLESGSPTPSAPANLVMAAIGATGASAFTQVGRVDAVWGTDLTISGGIGTTVPNLTTIKGAVTAGVAGGLITPRFAPEAAAATTLLRGSYALIL